MDVELIVTDISDENRVDKFQKAIEGLSKAMKVPATIKDKDAQAKEVYTYKAQTELYDRQMMIIGLIMDDLYSRICSTLDIKPVKRFSKAIDANAPKLGKEIIWNPRTGQAITQNDLDGLLKSIDKFLNRNVADKKDEIVISQATVARIISNLRRGGTSFSDARNIALDDLKTPSGTSWESITDYKQLRKAFPGDYSDLEFQSRIIGNHITQISDNTRASVANTLDHGFAAGLQKGEIAQQLFDKFGSLNKDWDRIIDTEGVNVFNQQYINEQRRDVAPGESLYFIRREFFDKKTCQFCRRAQTPVIAKWVDKPLQDDKIDDPVASIAIWAGKSNFGRKPDSWWWPEGSAHPNCFPDDTDVLTDNGWKRFKDVQGDDKIMSINPDTREVDFLNHKGLISYQYEGDMIRFSGRNFDLMATPDHNQIYLSRKRKVLKSKSMEELYDMGYVTLPRAISEWDRPKTDIQIPGTNQYIEDIKYARLWAWYLSDGSGHAGRERGYQIPQKDNTNIKKDLGDIITDSGHIRALYAPLLDEMKGRVCNNKYVPSRVKILRREALLAFLDSYSKADGTNRTGKESHSKSYKTKDNQRGFDVTFFTSSPILASDIGEIIIKAGYVPSYALQRPSGELLNFPSGQYKTNLDMHIIRMCKSKYRHFSRSSKSPGVRERIPYSGMVYDVELVKWHFLLVRRNGKVAWSGNCRGSWDRVYEEYGDIEL